MAKNPCFYLRIPHYIASWLRNCDHDNPIPIGAPIIIDRNSYLSLLFAELARPNLDNTVQPACLSQKQWDRIRKGQMIVSCDNSLRLDIQRKYEDPLQMHEVLLSLDLPSEILRDHRSGKPEPDSAYFNVYQPFQMPDIVIQNRRECRVQSDWYMPDPRPFCNELHKLYKIALVKFINDDRRHNMLNEIDRPLTQIIKKFMQWFDIRDGDKEMLQTRQMLRRIQDRHLLSLGPNANYDNDPDSNLDIQCLHEYRTPTDRHISLAESPPPNAPTRLFCPEHNRTFRSIRDAARILQIPEATIRNAVHMQSATHGLHFYRDSDFDRITSRNR